MRSAKNAVTIFPLASPSSILTIARKYKLLYFGIFNAPSL